ncbi:conserved hypothetical protein [Ricinus communis]|uniref:Uncharacterized protein n=1 Tax=Ricinus communis TaxID=3988 RepID=B9RSE5_RICCO|nr:conserved hypothetical protein [Ricinus communis]
MESLWITHQRFCQSFPKLINAHHSFSPISNAQLGFTYLLTERCKNVSLSVVRSDNRGGLANSPEGSSAVEDVKEEKGGHMLAADRDESGSAIGFNLISQSDIL